jgi:flagellar biosynthesis/type III secretory pathway protein FliH
MSTTEKAREAAEVAYPEAPWSARRRAYAEGFDAGVAEGIRRARAEAAEER